MEETKENLTSEWNEQIQYAITYFNETRQCRLAHANHDLIGWAAHIECKMLLTYPLHDDKTKNKIKEMRMKLLNTWGKYKSSVGQSKAAITNEFYNTLFDSEAEIDSLTNSKMPFLRMPNQFSPEDW